MVINYIYIFFLDQNKFNKKLKDTVGIERERVVLEVELQDQTAPAEWFFDDKPITPSDRYIIQRISIGLVEIFHY